MNHVQYFRLFAVMMLRKCGKRTVVCWLFVVTLGGVGIVTERSRLEAGRIYALATGGRTRAANFQGLHIKKLRE
jgi:ribose/xylose/arabinose/galactoside ABC-type transport system permease subunit